MHQKFSYLQSIKIIVLALLIAVGTSYLSADWTAPESTPPVCIAGDPGCDAPINVGNFSQVKQGNLNIRGVKDATHTYSYGLIVENGFVGIGMTEPSQKLDVAGNININTNGTNALFSTYKGANSDGNNIWIGGGGQRSLGAGDATYQGSYNTANGYTALFLNTTGYKNTANGMQALFTNTTGFQNTANGYGALFANTTGFSNTANGVGALQKNTTGYANTANGVGALILNTTGNSNTANGYGAGKYIADGIAENQTPNSSTYLGYDTRAKTDGGANEIVIGASTTGNGSYSVTLGNTTITKTILQGNVGIGTTTPSQKLEVDGNINIEGATNGIIMHDTVTTACYLVQIRNGAFAMTSHACKYPSPSPTPTPTPTPSPSPSPSP